jgi:hypothetical protein
MSSGSPSRGLAIPASTASFQPDRCSAKTVSVSVSAGATEFARTPLAAPPAGDVPHQGVGSGFGNAVADLLQVAIEGVDRRGGDDRPTATSQHLGDGVADSPQASRQADVDCPIPHLLGHFDRVGVAAEVVLGEVRGVVVQSIEAAMSLNGCDHKVANRLVVGGVEAHGLDIMSSFAQSSGSVLRALVIDVADHNPGTFLRRPRCRCGADARSTGRHEDDLAFQATCLP